jgi:16S rRNA (uracil1498-N3)-methyltransferase
MPRYDFHTPRLYVSAPLNAGASVILDHGQRNYLINVLRLNTGAPVLLFNGRDGEWRARLTAIGKRNFTADVEEQMRTQSPLPDLHLLFAPLKHARLDYLVQKAVEMGVSRLQPVMTQYTQVARVNVERMRANAIEAAEQCGILTLAEVLEPVDFDHAITGLGANRLLIFCDEDAEVKNLIDTLRLDAVTRPGLAALIGPEGGFAEEERQILDRRPNVIRISLGPRILRADTATVAALALIQAVLGDWR